MVHILVMVKHMVMFDVKPEFTFKVEVMDGIMREVIKKIAGQEANEERSYELIAKKCTEKKIKKSSQRYAYRGHHDEALGITGVIVMHTVEDEMYALSEFAGQFPMKDKTVKRVFRECPYEQAEHKVTANLQNRKMKRSR